MTRLLSSIPSPSFDRIALGPLDVRVYGIAIAVGVVAGFSITRRRFERRGGTGDDLVAVLWWAIPAGMLGARAYHVATDWPRYRGRWWDTLEVWEGGLGIWGAVAAGAVAAWVVSRRRGLDFGVLADAAAPALLVAQAVGRLGNWFNQELFGWPTELPWGLRIDPDHRPDRFASEATYHPTFLYEGVWNLALAAALVYAERRWRIGRGRLFALYVAGYTAGRFWIELLRIDAASSLLGVRVNVLTSAVVFTGVVLVFVAGRRRGDIVAA
ncbi:MAG: prolipoprotein diacylglyceryl transferase [Microbacteriaceae bacterium]